MLVAIGNYGFINLNEVEAVLPPESAPIKRMVIAAKDNGTCIDMTYGRRTKSVIVLRTGKIVLSSTLPDTLSNRMNNSYIYLKSELRCVKRRNKEERAEANCEML